MVGEEIGEGGGVRAGVSDPDTKKLKASGKVDAVSRPCRELVGSSNFLGSCRLLFHLVGAIIAVVVPATNLLFWIVSLLRSRLVVDRTVERTNFIQNVG